MTKIPSVEERLFRSMELNDKQCREKLLRAGRTRECCTYGLIRTCYFERSSDKKNKVVHYSRCKDATIVKFLD